MPHEAWADFRDAFDNLARTQNFRLFDVKKIVNKGPHVFYRLRLGKYRALFWMDGTTMFVEDIAPRGEAYRS